MNSAHKIRITFAPRVVRGWLQGSTRIVTLLLLVLISSSGASAYSVLTHEEIIDLVWANELSPLLLQRFPTLTEDQLKEAHGYAYGGAVIQDLGYYPFGSAEFSNLAHYARSREF